MESEISRYELRKLFSEVIELENAREKVKAEFKKSMDAIDKRLTEIRDDCPHPLTKYYGDASGNNDSTTECLICGASGKHLD